MLRVRTIICVGATVLFVCGLLAPLAAQQSDTIYIANGVVARIRTAGSYGSLAERSGAIDQAIAEVISTQDTQNPQVRVAQKDGKWSVYCGDVRIISVYPEEAEANNIAAKALAQIWASNIKARLPLSTPKSRMPAGAELPPVSTPPAAAGRSDPAPDVKPESTMSHSAALLLTIDAFNVARGLSEEDYLARRAEIARNLLKHLQPFMGGEEIVVPERVKPVSPVITDRETVGPPAPTPVPPPIEPSETAPAVTTDTTGIPTGHEGDPAYAKVPQKQRIKAKFALAQEPYVRMMAADPEAAAPIGELLKAARAALSAEKFDECESYLDHALGLLGVAYEQ